MTSSARATELPFYLTGNFAPVTQELSAQDLPIEGAIPPELCGLYLRNGPNPRGADEGHWFLGDGMLHGVRIEHGKAKWYRNRWVRTRCFLENAEFVDANGTVDRTAAKANTHVIGHAGRIFALVENAYPTEVSPELATVGICDFNGGLRTAMTAHPKRCPRTGELHFFGYDFMPPYLTYHVLDAEGSLVRSEAIDVPGPSMMHDFAITDGHVIFMDLPIVLNLEKAMQRGFPYEWSDDYGARIGVMPRGGGNADVRWLDIEPCYVFHPFNAFERDGSIIVDVVRYPELWRGGANTFKTAQAHRWTIGPQRDRVAEQHLDDRAIEFPRVDDRRAGNAHRFGYAVGNVNGLAEEWQDLVKYDFDRGSCETHRFPSGCAPGEPVFIAAAAGAAEDEGYVVTYVYDARRDGSDLVILDANAFGRPAVATIRLPQRVPFGFHGSWIADHVE